MPSDLASLRRSTFWKTSIPVFFLAALYPLTLIWQCGWTHAQHWLNNDVAFTIFVLWVFPLIVGLTSSALLPGIRRQSSTRLRRILYGTATLLLIAATIVVLRDVVRLDPETKQPLAPEPMHVPGIDAIVTDEQLRAPLRKQYSAMIRDAAVSTEEERLQAQKAYRSARAAAAAQYAEKHPGFKTIGEAFTDGSATWYVKFFLNLVVALTLALIFLILVAAVTVRLRHPTKDFNADALLLTYCLACLWFPLRLYTEWYLGFFSLARLEGYPAFWVLLVLGIIGLILLVIVTKPERLSITVPSIIAALGVAFSAIAWFNPTMLWYVGRIVETLDVWMFLVLGVIVVTPLAAIAVATANAALLQKVPE